MAPTWFTDWMSFAVYNQCRMKWSWTSGQRVLKASTVRSPVVPDWAYITWQISPRERPRPQLVETSGLKTLNPCLNPALSAIFVFVLFVFWYRLWSKQSPLSLLSNYLVILCVSNPVFYIVIYILLGSFCTYLKKSKAETRMRKRKTIKMWNRKATRLWPHSK